MEQVHLTTNAVSQPREAKSRNALKPDQQSKPYLRNQVERRKQVAVDQDNKIYFKKLADIKREPPAAYHAPNGYSSLRTGDKMRAQRPGGPKKAGQMACQLTHTGVVDWPPRALAPSAGEGPRTTFQASLRTSNALLAEKLRGTLRGRHDCPSYAQRSNGPHLQQDMALKYPRRASMYDGGAAKGDSPRRVQSARSNGVPKSVGMVRCAGCAVASYYNADGVHMHTCQECSQVWYCSKLCEELDRPHHIIDCKYHVNGVHVTGGVRSHNAQFATSTRITATRTQLTLLRQQNLNADFDVDSYGYLLAIQRQVAREIHRSSVRDAAQKAVCEHADNGMDGPRPCLCVGGKYN